MEIFEIVRKEVVVLLDIVREYSLYVWICFIAFPILFLMGEELWIRRRMNRIVYKWKRVEQNTIKSWEDDSFTTVDATIKKHVRAQLFSKEMFLGLAVLNIIAQPFVLKITHDTAPFLGWIVSFILFLLIAKKRERNLKENGLHLADIIHHEQLKKAIRDISQYRPYITYPYAFFYHYERLLLIPERMNRLIRSDMKSHIAIAESKVLGEEESFLLEETYIAVTGRLRNYDTTIETEGVKAMQMMIKCAKNNSLPIEVRGKAMELAKKLQYKSGYELIEEARKLEAQVSVNEEA